MKRKLFLLGMFKIPMIGFLRPRLLILDDSSARVRIRLRRRSKNHLNSMYFGALAVGADLCAGLHAFYFAEQQDRKMSFAFKDMSAEFLKRAESDVIFESTQGSKVQETITEALQSNERKHAQIEVLAKNDQDEIVARIQMTLSVKFK